MSVDFGWRRFNFFDKNIVQDRNDSTQKFLGLKDVCVDSWCSSGDSVYLGEAQGGVFRLGRFLDENYWKAFTRSLASLHSADIYLFSVGEDEETSSILKIWEREREGGDAHSPTLLRTVRLNGITPATNSPACAIAVHSSLTDIAIGFGDGSVALYQGNVIRDKGLSSRWFRIREPTPQDGPVTGLALAILPAGRLVVFVLTAKSVQSYIVKDKTVGKKISHDANGANKDCWTFDERFGSLVVASRDMVYFYLAEQCVDGDYVRGRCYQLGRNHEKLQLVRVGQHLALLTKQQAIIQSDEAEFMSMVTMYDVQGQYIGFSCSLPSLCRVFCVDQSLMILGKDGTLSELTEKNLNAKLDILFKKNLYDVAVILAKNHKDGSEQLPPIYAKYGDYLYGKGDFENAVNMYKNTIGFLEPSYVIKKYLEGSKLHQLCLYLEALHSMGRHNPHHTNILLNCYARLDDKKTMLEFVEKLINAADSKDSNMQAAFEVLRSSGLSKEASLLAVRLKMHEQAVAIMIDDLKIFPSAIKYIEKRPTAEICRLMEQYGRLLFENCPEATMQLMVTVLQTARVDELDPTQLLKVFMGDATMSANFIQCALDKVSGSSRTMLAEMLLELRLRAYAKDEISDEECKEMLFPFIESGHEARAYHLAQLFDCPPLIEHLLRSMHKTRELLQFYMKKGNLKAVIQLCKENSTDDMWLDALQYVAKTENNVDENLIANMLESIEASKSVHPLVVLEILSRNSQLQVSVVKEYIIKWLKKQESQIALDRKAIAESEKRMAEIEKHIESLKFNVQVLQVNKCYACDTALQLPAVHFLCRHSYHVHCFESYSTDRPDKCPACSTRLPTPDKRDNMSDKEMYMKFKSELNTTPNSMELISKYLRCGLFDDTKRSIKKSTPMRPSMNSSTSQSSSVEVHSSPNPFLAERSSSTVSSASSRPTVRPINPFDEPDVIPAAAPLSKGKNPFESTNPFDDD